MNGTDRASSGDDGQSWGYIDPETSEWIELPKGPGLIDMGPPPFDVTLPDGRVRRVVHKPPVFHWFECPECEFSSVQLASFTGTEECPLCAGDSGHSVRMKRRACEDADKPEGFDARAVEDDDHEP